MRRRWMVFTTAVFLGVCTDAAAQQKPDLGLPRVVFDHLATSTSSEPPQRSAALVLGDGDSFVVEIRNTCPDAFEYAIRGILKAPQPAEAVKGVSVEEGVKREPATKAVSTKLLGPTTHEERYGGYIVDIVPGGGDDCAIYTEIKSDKPAAPQPENVEKVTRTVDGKEVVSYEAGGKEYSMEPAPLRPAQFFVPVTTDEWDYSVSGGFAFSAPGDRKYSLQPKSGSTTVKIVTRDLENEADAVTNATAFVHLFRSQGFFNRFAPTFGMSVDTTDKPGYFGGIGWRLGRRATIIGGLSLTHRRVLPDGVQEDTETENGDLLKTLGTEPKLRVFVGVSFSFLPGEDKLKKPFAGEEKKPGEGQ